MDKTQQLMVFAIDDKLRTITMPNNGSVFGVSGDIEVNQIFQLRKIPNMYMVYPLKTNFRLIKYDISILTEHI